MKETNSKLSFKKTLKEIAKFHFILDEGRKGHHLLFTPEMIRETFSHETGELMTTFQTRIDDINRVLNHTFMLPTFEEKGKYIETLAPELQSALVYGYFQLLDANEEGVTTATVH